MRRKIQLVVSFCLPPEILIFIGARLADQFFEVARHAGLDVPYHTALVPGAASTRCPSPDSSAADGGGGGSSTVAIVTSHPSTSAMSSISAADLEPLRRFVAKRDAAGAMTSLLMLIRRRLAQQQHKADASVSDVAAGIHAHAVQALRQASMLPPGDCRNRALPALSSSSLLPLPWEECHESFHHAMIENVASMNRCKLDADAAHVAHAMVAVACLGGWTRAQFQSISVAAFRAPFFTRHPAWLLVLLTVLANFDAAAVIELSVPAHLSGWAARAVLSAKEEFGTAFDGTIE